MSIRSFRALAVLAVAVPVLAACSSSGSPSGGGSNASTGGGSSSPSAPVASSAGASSASGTSSSDDNGGGDDGGGGGTTVKVEDFTFTPATLTVKTGTKVTWNFDDTAQHTVSDPTAKIMSNPLAKGQSFSYTFTTPGTYNYICSIHQYMHGTVVVK